METRKTIAEISAVAEWTRNYTGTYWKGNGNGAFFFLCFIIIIVVFFFIFSFIIACYFRNDCGRNCRMIVNESVVAWRLKWMGCHFVWQIWVQQPKQPNVDGGFEELYNSSSHHIQIMINFAINLLKTYTSFAISHRLNGQSIRITALPTAAGAAAAAAATIASCKMIELTTFKQHNCHANQPKNHAKWWEAYWERKKSEHTMQRRTMLPVANETTACSMCNFLVTTPHNFSK